MAATYFPRIIAIRSCYLPDFEQVRSVASRWCLVAPSYEVGAQPRGLMNCPLNVLRAVGFGPGCLERTKTVAGTASARRARSHDSLTLRQPVLGQLLQHAAEDSALHPHRQPIACSTQPRVVGRPLARRNAQARAHRQAVRKRHPGPRSEAMASK